MDPRRMVHERALHLAIREQVQNIASFTFLKEHCLAHRPRKMMTAKQRAVVTT
jgi:hypothetical protein